MANENPLARFAVESGRITAHDVVKPKLFEPTKEHQVSVARIRGLEEPEICCLGIDVAREHPTSHALYGWGKLDRAEVYELGLQLEDDDPPSRHSNIIGWPETESRRKNLQYELAERSQPVRLDPPIPISV